MNFSLYAMRRLAAWLLIGVSLGLMMASSWGQSLLPVPVLSARVIDQTNTLSAEQQQALGQRLAEFEATKGTQIVVLMVSTTAPEDIAAYANRVANAWKIGRRDVGDGVLLLVAKDERRMRLEVAKTLEGAVPDLAAARIIDQQMKPAFRNGDFAGGIDAALTQLMARISGEALPEVSGTLPHPGVANDRLSGIDVESLLFLFFLPVAVVATILRKLVGNIFGLLLTAGLASGAIWFVTSSLLASALAGVAALFIGSVASSIKPGALRQGRSSGGYTSGGWIGGGGWSGGGGGSWGGGGGFSSGGGGDFGGGGASGDW